MPGANIKSVAANEAPAAMIYLSKPAPGAPRYIAEQHRGRVLLWWTSPTGKVADLVVFVADVLRPTLG
jgi:hypothetical protein